MGELSSAAEYYRLRVLGGSQEAPAHALKVDGRKLAAAQAPVADDDWEESREEDLKRALAEQRGQVPPRWRQEYEDKAATYWHRFYRRNSTNFYKDRHYLDAVFPELHPDTAFWASGPPELYGDGEAAPGADASAGAGTGAASGPSEAYEERAAIFRGLRDGRGKRVLLVDIGCGVGNTVLPLLETHPGLHAVALDFARSGIEFLRQSDAYERHAGRVYADVFDGTSDPVPQAVRDAGGADLVILLFCLSAIPQEKQQRTVATAAACLRRGGRLLFRDYGRYDLAQLRFKGKQNKLDQNWYVRSDGTCSYFFALEEVDGLCRGAGLRKVELGYIRRRFENRQKNEERRRVWVHAKYEKP